jgi:hypothetical protein
VGCGEPRAHAGRAVSLDVHAHDVVLPLGNREGSVTYEKISSGGRAISMLDTIGALSLPSLLCLPDLDLVWFLAALTDREEWM